MHELKDKIVLITGGAKGIGAAISREVLKEGAQHLRILDLDEFAGVQLQNELNKKHGADKTKFVKCDVTKDDQLFGAMLSTKEGQGFIDVVINNAGVANEVDYAAIRKQIEINVTAVINGTLKAVELMDRNKGGRGGTVINVASTAGLYPLLPPLFTYSATKSAVLLFTSCFGKIQSESIRIMALCFGATDTNIQENLFTFGKTGDEAMAAILTNHEKQSAESAARSSIQAYKSGRSASIWVISNNKPAKDITEIIEKYDKEIAYVLSRI